MRMGRSKAKEIAASVLSGERDVLSACFELVPLLSSVPDLAEEHRLLLQGVGSELHDLPVGPARALWNPEALARRDQEALRFARTMRPRLEETYRAILALPDCAEIDQ